MKKTFLNILFVFAVTLAIAQVPAKNQSKPVMITGATIHTGTGQIFLNGFITFENGKITGIGEMGTAPAAGNVEVINLQGKHIYPGFILPVTNLGLNEISAVRATVDNTEVGAFNPNVRSIIAYNTDSELIPVTRSNGILMAQVAPEGGFVMGSSSIVQLDGWNWEDAAYKIDDGIHFNWPQMLQGANFFTGEPAKKNENYERNVNEISQLLSDGYAYSIAPSEPKNLKLEAIKGLFDGSSRAYLNADFSKEIIEGIQLLKKHNVKNIVLVGGNDSWMLTDFLKDNNIPVILNNVHRLPAREDEDVDLPYKLPFILKKAGINYCLSYNGISNARNLPFFAGTSATHGVSKEDAVMSITLNTAKILGIDKTTGSLEVGKDATLIVSTGDALDMKTSIIEQAFIRGRKLDLTDKHKQLYQKFKNKYDDAKK
jgi:imidazolonepropionase-like amidohydrolase